MYINLEFNLIFIIDYRLVKFENTLSKRKYQNPLIRGSTNATSPDSNNEAPVNQYTTFIAITTWPHVYIKALPNEVVATTLKIPCVNSVTIFSLFLFYSMTL